MTPTSPDAELAHRRTLRALIALLLALFAATLSSTVVSIALPEIIGALDGTQTQYTWVITAALLTATASTPIWGKLADLFDKLLLIQIAIGIFVVASVGAGFSQDAGQLIAFRAVQGLGVGGLQALVQIAIAAMIAPRERGRYSGYQSAATAMATIGGPLLGGLIADTPWLGWRWCLFVGIPVAAVALVGLQRALDLPVVRRAQVRIDYAGATLIAVGVSLLLIWITFVGESFAWGSWPSAAMVGGGVVLLGAAVVVESRFPEPVVPLRIVAQRTTALAILGSLAVGMAMFGGAVFLGQYFQVARGYAPVEAGLLTVPLMLGLLISSVVGGRLISRTGRIKPFIVTGTVALTAGFALLAFVDHTTALLYLGVAMFLVGCGIGLTLQNLVLVVQNTVALADIGSASSSVSFFRSLGGTIGVSVLGAVLARQVAANVTDGLRAAGYPTSGDVGGSLDVGALPGPVQEIVRAAYGDATGSIFGIAAAVAVVSIAAAVALRPAPLRRSLDLPDAARAASVAADAATAAPPVDQVDVEVDIGPSAGR